MTNLYTIKKLRTFKWAVLSPQDKILCICITKQGAINVSNACNKHERVRTSEANLTTTERESHVSNKHTIPDVQDDTALYLRGHAGQNAPLSDIVNRLRYSAVSTPETAIMEQAAYEIEHLRSRVIFFQDMLSRISTNQNSTNTVITTSWKKNSDTAPNI